MSTDFPSPRDMKILDKEGNERRFTPIDPLAKVKPHKLSHYPKPGHAWHPFRQWPRNERCFCGSQKKAKKCCLPGLPLTIEAKDFERYTKAAATAESRSRQADGPTPEECAKIEAAIAEAKAMKAKAEFEKKIRG